MELGMFVAPPDEGALGKEGIAYRRYVSGWQRADRLTAASLLNTLFRGFVFQGGFLWRLPEVAFQVHARLSDFDAFAFEEFSLQGSVRLADEDFAALTDDAMPGNAFAGRSGGQGPCGAVRAAGAGPGFRAGPASYDAAARSL